METDENHDGDESQPDQKDWFETNFGPLAAAAVRKFIRDKPEETAELAELAMGFLTLRAKIETQLFSDPTTKGHADMWAIVSAVKALLSEGVRTYQSRQYSIASLEEYPSVKVRNLSLPYIRNILLRAYSMKLLRTKQEKSDKDASGKPKRYYV